jgi:hypothetical protein
MATQRAAPGRSTSPGGHFQIFLSPRGVDAREAFLYTLISFLRSSLFPVSLFRALVADAALSEMRREKD